MCKPCEALKQRSDASSALLQAVEDKYGLKRLYRPVEDGSFADVIERLNAK